VHTDIILYCTAVRRPAKFNQSINQSIRQVVVVVVVVVVVPIWGDRCPEKMRNSTRFT